MLNTVMPLSKWKRRTRRLNGCHTVPEGITTLLSVLSNFKVRIIIVFKQSDLKINSFGLVQSGLVSRNYDRSSGVPKGGWGLNPPPPKFRRPSKIVPNSTRL